MHLTIDTVHRLPVVQMTPPRMAWKSKSLHCLIMAVSKPVNQIPRVNGIAVFIPVHTTNWNIIPSPVSNFLMGMKLLPKNSTAKAIPI